MFKNRKYKIPGAPASCLSLCTQVSHESLWAYGGQQQPLKLSVLVTPL